MIFGFGVKKPDLIGISKELDIAYNSLSREDKSRFNFVADSVHRVIHLEASGGFEQFLDNVVLVRKEGPLYDITLVRSWARKDKGRIYERVPGSLYSVCFHISSLITVAWLKEGVDERSLKRPGAYLSLNPALSRISEEIALWVLKQRNDLVDDEENGFSYYKNTW